MRLIIAGSRRLSPSIRYLHAARREWEAAHDATVTSLVSGGARGVDSQAEVYAQHQGLPIEILRADWSTHGRRAGYLRNAEMADAADGLLLIWDGRSPGSKMMLDIARDRGLPITEKLLAPF